jgi:hypothetical protein
MGDELELAADKHVRYIVTVEKVRHPSICFASSFPIPTARFARYPRRRRTRSSRW